MSVDKPGFTHTLRRKRWLPVLIALVLAGGGWYYLDKRNGGPTTEPLLATVTIGSIENTITAAGSLQPRKYVDVGAQVSGQLEQLYVEVGDEVEAGQLLAEIDARVQQSRVNSSRASLESQQAQVDARKSALELARANAERQQRLHAANATSQLDYDTAMNNLANAEASLIQLEKQIEQSRASLEQEETQLEFTSIYAPITGTVVTIEMNEGVTLNATQTAPTILRIADLSTMTVETEISEADIGKLNKGMDVYFTTLGGGDRRWYSTLRQIEPTPVVENNVVLYTGLFDAENSDGTLLPEMTAQVYFVTSSAQNVRTVPVGALSYPGESDGFTAGAFMTGQSGEGAPVDMAVMRERFEEMRASGQVPEGFRQGGGVIRSAGGGSGDNGPRPAMVTVVNSDGTQEERRVMVGVTSRVAAEIISGLEPGEQVVAGILETGGAGTGNNNDNGGPPMRVMRGF